MKVGFKLFASLTDLLPPERDGNRVELDLEEGTTIADVIARFRVPERSAHLVLVNGLFIPREARASRRLAEHDELAVWPPIAGG
ncbi:MAG: MoaD/ThiS family protein [Aromatoleum sp.]|jgi:sulfur carrier protein ThiS|uniref:sulfur carrier protein ThiS n=1 Tax=Aromatoleum sp. TaxID=2307007 RepID=UPI0028944412|nr:MoaD/ThiS family protein [Aromatoleum sp.]MDT3672437.1 MoaD/ThiS family protein [Aromatoleum sp.]